MKQCDGQLAMFEEDQRTRLLREELTMAPYCCGKLHIEEHFKTHSPSDDEFADFLRKYYYICGHCGPDMPMVDYDGKGIRIRPADRSGDFRYSWKEVAKEIRRCIVFDAYVTPLDVHEAVDHFLFYLNEGWDVDWCKEHLTKLLNHPKLSITDKQKIKEVITWESQS